MRVPPCPRGITVDANLRGARVQFAANVLLALLFVYIVGGWLLSPAGPRLDKLVVKQALGDNTFLYGARDNGGGATTRFSYLYFVGPEWGEGQAALQRLGEVHPFLISDDDAVQAQQVKDLITIKVQGRVLEYRSDALIGTGDDYRQVKFALVQQPGPAAAP
ncbi:hypothetical protein [Pseudomonas sp. TE3610]